MRSKLKTSFRKKSFTSGDHFRNGSSATGRHLLSKFNPDPNADEKHSSGMEDLQKSSLDGKRNQIVMITFLKFVSIFLKYLHACIHGSLSIKIYQMRVNEPTTFNSGLALCLFLSGLLNTKPFFSSHSFLHICPMPNTYVHL